MTHDTRLTSAQRTLLWNCIQKKRRGFIAYNETKRVARRLARKRLIKRAPHRIVFPWGKKDAVRPWMITARGYHAYFGTFEP